MYSNANMANTALAGAYLAEEDRKRREQESAPRQDNLLDTVGKIALAAGATAGAVVAGRRLTGGQNTSATFDLSQLQPKNLRRAAARVVAPQETVAPSRPAPTTSMERQRQAEEFTRQARSERMPGVVQTNLPQASVARDPWTGRETVIDPFGPGTAPPVRRAEAQAGGQALPVGRATQEELAVRQQLLEDTELLKLVEAEQMAAANVLPENRAEQSRQQAQVRRAQSQLAQETIDDLRAEAQPQSNFAGQYLQQAGYQEADTLVDQQVSKTLVNSDQTVNAVNSAEDQQTGRVKMAFQRNEDENLSAIEFAEDQVDAQLARMAQAAPETAGSIEVDAAINQVAAQRPDGMPLDQVESLMWGFEEQMERQGQKAQAWLNKQLEIQKRREPVTNVETQVYDLVAQAATQGVQLEPSRAVTLLTNPTAELTGAEQRLFATNPSIGKIALKGQTFEPGQQQTGASMGIKQELLRSLPNVGQDPTSAVTQAASGTSIRGRSRIPNIPDESRQRVSSTGRPVTADDVSIDEGGTVTVSPGEELTEMVFESREPTYTRFVRDSQSAQQRPTFFGPGLASAEQLKVGMKEEYAPKGMRAVQTEEGKPYFVPVGDPGGIGVYGEERRFASGPIVKFDDPQEGRIAGQYTKTAMRAPTEMPFKEKQKGGAGFNDLTSDQLRSFIANAPEGRVRSAGQQELARREATKQSLAASELYRRGRIEGLF